MATIRIGQPVRVRLSQTANDFYLSRLVELTPETYFIDVPLHHRENRAVDIKPQSVVWIEFQAQDGALCSFPTKYIESLRMPNLVWKIQKPDPKAVIREQRREFVRVPADLKVKLDYTADGLPKQAEVYSRDVSGGGIALYLPRHVILRPGVMVETRFTLPNGDFPVDVKSVVIRVSERNESGIAVGSLQFMNIKESVRQRVIQYTFWRQRALM